jgi:hypothetical protein
MEYENFTHLPGESIDTMFQRFTMIVNNMRENVTMLPYDDHDRALKLLHSLDHTVWSAKFEVIMESNNFETLTVDELFFKIKSSEFDRGVRGKIQNPTNSHSLALISGSRSNANLPSRQFSLSALVSMPDEEFDVLGEEDRASVSRRFKRVYVNRKNVRRSTGMCYKCGKHGYFIAECLENVENKVEHKHRPRIELKHRSRNDYKNKNKSERMLRKSGSHKKRTSTRVVAALHQVQEMKKKMATDIRASSRARTSTACALSTKAFSAWQTALEARRAGMMTGL